MTGRRRWQRRKLLASGVGLTAAMVLGRGRVEARAARVADEGADEEVSFVSGADTLYGSLRLPAGAGAQPLPGALILAGSGPTDRDGNSAALPGDVGTLRNFAAALAGAGVVSLRYDKLGSGKTGLGSYASHPQDIATIDFATFVQEALDGLALLTARPEVDPTRLMVLGHSEGGLIALAVAQTLQTPVSALALAAPIAVRYLDLLRRQYTEAYNALVQAGKLTQAQADALIADLGVVLDSIRATGQLPATSLDPSLRRTLGAALNFLYTADMVDPLAIAVALPALPTLILHGAVDSQVLTAEMVVLAQAFASGGNAAVEYDELPGVDHVFKVVTGTPDPASDYTNPALPFSPAAAADLQAFAQRTLGATAQ